MFEFDEQKSRTNKEKHGIDFRQAQALWDDADLFQVEAKASTIALDGKLLIEKRYGVVGEIDGKCWTAVFTQRGGYVRLISVRRARSNEQEKYSRNKKS
jgi:uncharacterized DUF497 family protein